MHSDLNMILLLQFEIAAAAPVFALHADSLASPLAVSSPCYRGCRAPSARHCDVPSFDTQAQIDCHSLTGERRRIKADNCHMLALPLLQHQVLMRHMLRNTDIIPSFPSNTDFSPVVTTRARPQSSTGL